MSRTSDDELEAGTVIPHDALQPETLRRVVEEFVTREGTEYGRTDVGLEAKVASVCRQLEKGEAVLTYDSDSGTIGISKSR